MSTVESTGTSRKTQEQYENMKRLLGGFFFISTRKDEESKQKEVKEKK